MRDKITFSPNIPTQVVLDGPGELQPSKNGSEEYRYFLAADRIMWVPPEVHHQIEASGAQDGDTLTVEKCKRGAAAATWKVTHHQDEPAGYGYSAAPTPTTPPPTPKTATREPRETTDDRAARGIQQRPQPTPATPAADQPLTAADRLAGALAAAIDATAEAAIYGKRKGLILTWAAADIRALTVALIATQQGAK